MPDPAKQNESRSRLSRELILVTLLLLVILLALFHQSFESGETLFSNDGPLGALVAYSDVAPSFFTGSWHTLNWIGSHEPSALPNLTYGMYLVWGAIAHSKFFVPLALLLLGIGTWLLLRESKLNPTACLLGAIASVLNTDPFSYACWGLPSLTLCMAATFFAFAALINSRRNTWIKLALGGCALGMAIMEGYDNGAIFSLYVAACVLFKSWLDNAGTLPGLIKGVGKVALVAICAALVSAHALSTLIGTQVKGIVDTQQDVETKERHWDQATMWSLPKLETLRVIIPGLFGYRMDTPEGGNYWGSVGQTPGVPQSRHSGSGVYAGVLVVLLAGFAIAQAARKKDSPFTETDRKLIWFWTGAAVVSLLLAFGRHAPFYQFFYRLPYFSTIRNPIKFMHPFSLCVVILFGYGLEALWRRYLLKAASRTESIGEQLKSWWSTAPAWDRRWTWATLTLAAAAFVGWLRYGAAQQELVQHLQAVGFQGDLATTMSRFSVTEAGWFVLFLVLCTGGIVLILSGGLAGPRARWAGILLGLLLVADLVRANSRWIVYYNYHDKYASNPVIDQFRSEPYQHRVAARLAPLTGRYLASGQAQQLLAGVAEEWLQQQYQFYRIQSLDIVQMPRMPETDASFMSEPFSGALTPSDFVQLSALTTKLTNHSDAVSQFLWERLSPQTQAALQQKAASPQSMGNALADDLNRLIRAELIYETARFTGVKLSNETRGLVAQPVSSHDLVRVNRALLEEAFPGNIAQRSPLAAFGRLWQLTNTRYILGMKGFLDFLNQQMDPAHQSFRVKTAFDFKPRPSAGPQGASRIEDITTEISPEGQFAVFEFGAALPRAALFTRWEVMTNDSQMLLRLGDPAFDPQSTVLVAPAGEPLAPPSATNASPGKLEITHYEPKRIVLQSEASSPEILLLNDKFDPNWRVAVDGKPETLLRCNYIMRGVYLHPGQHSIEFHFDPPHGTLYVSLAAIIVGLGLCGFLAFSAKPDRPVPLEERPVPTGAATNSKNKV